MNFPIGSLGMPSCKKEKIGKDRNSKKDQNKKHYIIVGEYRVSSRENIEALFDQSYHPNTFSDKGLLPDWPSPNQLTFFQGDVLLLEAALKDLKGD